MAPAVVGIGGGAARSVGGCLQLAVFHRVGHEDFAGVLPLDREGGPRELEEDDAAEGVGDLVHAAGGVVRKGDLVAEPVGHADKAVVRIEIRLAAVLIGDGVGVVRLGDRIVLERVVLKAVVVLVDGQGEAVFKVHEGLVAGPVVLGEHLLDGGQHEPPAVAEAVELVKMVVRTLGSAQEDVGFPRIGPDVAVVVLLVVVEGSVVVFDLHVAVPLLHLAVQRRFGGPEEEAVLLAHVHGGIAVLPLGAVDDGVPAVALLVVVIEVDVLGVRLGGVVLAGEAQVEAAPARQHEIVVGELDGAAVEDDVLVADLDREGRVVIVLGVAP